MGYTRSIRGVYVGYTYVSGMCRVCIGYVSGKCRRGRGARGAMEEKEKRNIDFFRILDLESLLLY